MAESSSSGKDAAKEEGPTLESIFEAYCNFGNRNVVPGSVPTIDTVKFAKMTRETKIMDKKNVVPATVDLVFTKVKGRTERRINFAQATQALAMLGEKKYPTLAPEEATEKIHRLIIKHGGPGLAKVTKTDDKGWVKKQTDSSQYTGTHALRFDKDGKGRGKAGRDAVVKGGPGVDVLGSLLDRTPANVRGVKK